MFPIKTLGIIGGLGPEATIEYYKRIIAFYRARNPDDSYPFLIINSIDLTRGVRLIESNNLDGLVRYLLSAIEKLAKAGADFGLIAANTPHLVFDDLAAQSPIPLISIVESTCQEAKRRGLKKLALIATRFTMQSDFFARVFSRQDIELVVPETPDQDYIHDKYFHELVQGKFLPETRANLLAIIDRLHVQQKIDGVILGGTELPLILTEANRNGIPLLDTIGIHVEAAVEKIFS